MAPPSRYTKEKLLAAIRRHSGDVAAAISLAGAPSGSAFKSACRHYGIKYGEEADAALRSAGITPAAHPPIGGDAWDKAARDQLTELWNRRPEDRPMLSKTEIGEIMGRTEHAIQTAASRFGLPRRDLKVYRDYPSGPDTKTRDCLNCERPFSSTSKFNRLCVACKEAA